MNSLQWHRTNQPLYRRERYCNLQAEVQQARDEQREVQRCGQRVHLPSSFVGGPRFVSGMHIQTLAVGAMRVLLVGLCR